jgi:F-type H+-transporting ATPase subunit b
MNLNATLIIEIASFLILMFLLVRLLYRPILKFLDERALSIKRLVEEAEKARDQAQQELLDAQRQLANARQGALQLRERAQIDVASQRRRILEEAQAQAKKIVEQAKQELVREARQAKAGLLKEIAEISLKIAHKVLSREVKKEDHEKLIEQLVEEIR